MYLLTVTYECTRTRWKDDQRTTERTVHTTRRVYTSKTWLGKMIACHCKAMLPRWRNAKALSYKVERMNIMNSVDQGEF